mmetsp:Transcript_14039/g.29098  ORF Transcript_14039/g.29098 Transcript_14039/m.29098 type:complete len:212 (-) Transcript_14039:3916-4551(-)
MAANKSCLTSRTSRSTWTERSYDIVFTRTSSDLMPESSEAANSAVEEGDRRRLSHPKGRNNMRRNCGGQSSPNVSKPAANHSGTTIKETSHNGADKAFSLARWPLYHFFSVLFGFRTPNISDKRRSSHVCSIRVCKFCLAEGAILYFGSFRHPQSEEESTKASFGSQNDLNATSSVLVCSAPMMTATKTARVKRKRRRRNPAIKMIDSMEI